MSLPVLLVLAVKGSDADDDGGGVRLWCEGEDGEFIIALPIRQASLMQVALQDAAADAQRTDGTKAMFQIAESETREPSGLDGHDLLTLTLEGGMRLHFLTPSLEARPDSLPPP